MFLLSGTQASLAQNVLVNPGKSSYPTLNAAFSAINNGVHTGVIDIDIIADTTETSAAVLFDGSGNTGTNYTRINIKPVGARSIGGNLAGALIRFDGADNVSFDGLNQSGNSLTLLNSNTTTSGAVIELVGAANNNRFVQLSVLGSGTNASGVNNYSGLVLIGTSGSSTGNNNNEFANNRLGPANGNLPAKGFFCLTSASDALANKNLIIRNNQLFDLFAATGPSSMILLSGSCHGALIEGNRFFQTAPRTMTASAEHRVIELSGFGGLGPRDSRIINNTFGFASADGTGLYEINATAVAGKFRAMLLSSLPTGPSQVSNNLISNIAFTTGDSGTLTSAPFVGIQVRAGPVSISANVLRNLSVQSSSSSSTHIAAIQSLSTQAVEIIDNQIEGMSQSATSGQHIGYGITISPTAREVNHLIARNTIGGSAEASISQNAATTSAQLHGIFVGSNFAGNINDNLVRNLATNSANSSSTTSSLNGISSQSGGPLLLDGNIIYGLTQTNPAAAVYTNGINHFASGVMTVQRSLIYGLRSDSSSASAVIAGINLSSGANTLRNNMLRLGRDASNADITAGLNIFGIRDTSNAGVADFWHNTIVIEGANVSGSANSIALFSSLPNSPSRRYRNNVLVNLRSNGSGSGNHYGIQVSTVTALTSNHNDIFVSGTGSVFGRFASTDAADLAAWRTATGGQDLNSVSVDPLFVSGTDVHLQNSSPLRDLAANLGVLDDIDYQLRPGGNSLVDIGADEVDGTNQLMNDVAALAIVSPANGAVVSGTSPFTVSATFNNPGVNNLGNVPVRLTITNSASVVVHDQVASILVLPRGEQRTVTFAPVSIATRGQYSLRVQSEFVGDPISANNQVTSSITIEVPLAGVINVGSGGEFDSLSNNGGVFQTLNQIGASADLTLNIISDLTAETGTHTLNQLAAGIDVLIKPSGGARLISGSNGKGGLLTINGADNVTVDGALNGGSSADLLGGDPTLRQLTLINQGAGTNATVIAVLAAGANAGASNVLIKNVRVEGSAGGDTGFGIRVGQFGNNNLSNGNHNVDIDNCDIRRVDLGIHHVGSSAANAGNNDTDIQHNRITATGTDRVKTAGIVLQYQDQIRLRLNDIAGMSRSDAVDVLGMGIGPGFGTFGLSNTMTTGGGAAGAVIERNRIRDIVQTGTGSAAGLALSPATGLSHFVYNNMVSGVLASGVSGEILSGIVAVTGSSFQSSILLEHNSVHLFGSIPVDALAASAAISIQGSQSIAIRNVIANNSIAPALNAPSFAVLRQSSGFINSQNNLLFAPVEAALVSIAGTAGDLAFWSAAVSNNTSFVGNAGFISDDDLHLSTTSAAINRASVNSVVNDFDGQTRPLSNRDIGADEVFLGNLSMNTSLNLGSIELGQTVSGAVQLFNTGDGPLTISSLSAALSPFALSATGTCPSAPFTITNGQSCVLVYQFSPSARGPFSQVIAVNHDGVGVTSFGLTGTGLAPAQLTSSPNNLDYGQVAVGAIRDKTATLSNTGDVSLQVSSINADNLTFTRAGGSCPLPPFALLGNSQCTVIYRFAPVNSVPQTGTLTVLSNAGTVSFGLSGDGVRAEIVVEPAVTDFGTIVVGSSATRVVTLRNIGDDAATINAIPVPNSPALTRIGGDCAAPPFALAINASCSLDYRFAPSAAGNVSETITIGVDAPAIASTIELRANGIQGSLNASAASIEFGSQLIGSTSATQSVSLSNTGSAALSIDVASANLPFVRVADSCGGNPIALAVNTSCTLSYQFAPLAPGAFTESIDLVHNGTGSSGLVLNGQGQQFNFVFANGFETNSRRALHGDEKRLLPINDIADLLDTEAVLIEAIDDARGPALVVYARKRNQQIELALVLRDAFGHWQHRDWLICPGNCTLTIGSAPSEHGVVIAPSRTGISGAQP
jgi:hypothetical protein